MKLRYLRYLLFTLLLSVSILSGCKDDDKDAVNEKKENVSEIVEIEETAEDNFEEVPIAVDNTELSAQELMEKSMEAYDAFINNKTSLYFDNANMNRELFYPEGEGESLFSKDKGYTFDDMAIAFGGAINDFFEKSYITKISYGYIDCGLDGVNELALDVRFRDYPGIEYKTLMVIKYLADADRLEFCYGITSGYRSDAELSKYGVITYHSSVSAYEDYYSTAFINVDGRYVLDYEEMESYNDMMLNEAAEKLYEEGDEEAVKEDGSYHNIRSHQYCFEDADFYADKDTDDKFLYTFYAYSYYDEDECPELFSDNELYEDGSIYSRIWNASGRNWCSPDELSKKVLEHEEEIGLTPDIMEYEEADFIELDAYYTNTGAEIKRVKNNNGHFTAVGNEVYFHMPDGEALDTITLWDEFADADQGYTALYAYNSETKEIKKLDENNAWGTFTVSGPVLGYGGYRFNNDIPTTSILSYDLSDGKANIPDMEGIDLIAGDNQCHYMFGINYVADSQTGYEDGYYLTIILNGELDEEVYLGESFDYVAAGNDYLLYTGRGSDINSEMELLFDLDLRTKEVHCLGTLEASEYGYARAGQSIIVNDRVYLSYDNYEGTGNFYAGSRYYTAVLGMEDSLNEVELAGSSNKRADEWEEVIDKAPSFKIENNEMTICDGIPNTAGIVEDEIGYYNDEGDFVAVAAGFGRIDEANDGEHVREVEVAELVGDAIYVLINEADHISDEDIGWRYAYKRNSVIAKRIDINTDEVTELISVK